MVSMRKQYEAAFKTRIALKTVKGEKTIAQIASEFKVHPKQIRQWRRRLLDVLPEVFSNRRPKQEKDRDELETELLRQIGQLKVEVECLKEYVGFAEGELDRYVKLRSRSGEKWRHWIYGDWRKGFPHPVAPTGQDWAHETEDLALQIRTPVLLQIAEE